MLAATHRERSVRVLCLFPHPRFSGHAVVDEDGLVLRATFTMRTRRFRTLADRIASIEAQLHDSVLLYRPDVLAIVRATGCEWLETTAARVLDAAGAIALPLRVMSEEELEELFHLPDIALYDQLGQSLTRTFFPQLLRSMKSWRRGDEDVRRRLRPMWKAAAGAVAALAERRPCTISALAQGPIPAGLASLIERTSRPAL